MTLVAAPYHARKLYALDAWAAATSAYERLLSVCDEGGAAHLAERGIPYVVYAEPKSHRVGDKIIYGPHFNAAWQAIIENCDGHTHILSLDTDVIAPPDILEVMEAHYTGGFLIHGVPWREGYLRPGKGYETSCALASVADWKASLARCERERNYYDEPRNLYGVVRDMDHTDVDLVELVHLDNGGATPKS
jgi:hypothetical protein